MFGFLLKDTKKKHDILTRGIITPEPGRCVQCGVCSYNCPIGIDVRRHALLGTPVKDSACLTCGECTRRCPRGVLHFSTERENA